MSEQNFAIKSEKTGVARPERIIKKKLRDDTEGREDFEVGFETEAQADLPEKRKKERPLGHVDRFMRAIEEKDLAAAYFELRGLRFLERGYNDLKHDFIDLLDYYLEQSDSELVKKYRADLELIREFVLRDKLDYLTVKEDMLKQLSDFGQIRSWQQLEAVAEKAKREVVANRFHVLMNDPDMDPYKLFFQLVKAKELALPEFVEWKKRFLLRLNSEIEKDDKDLLKATKVHLVSFRQRMPDL